MSEWNHEYVVCNYCINATAQDHDCIYCDCKNRMITGKAITSGRSCKYFVYCYVSAINLDKNYKQNKKRTPNGQIKFEI